MSRRPNYENKKKQKYIFVNFLKQVEKRYYCCFKYNFCINAKIYCEKSYQRKNRKRFFLYCEIEKQQKLKV